jgi:hypothetical protein
VKIKAREHALSSVKRIAKWVFYMFLSASVSMLILQVLSYTGADKYRYYVAGVCYVWIHLILDRATIEWRSK